MHAYTQIYIYIYIHTHALFAYVYTICIYIYVLHIIHNYLYNLEGRGGEPRGKRSDFTRPGPAPAPKKQNALRPIRSSPLCRRSAEC